MALEGMMGRIEVCMTGGLDRGGYGCGVWKAGWVSRMEVDMAVEGRMGK